MKSAMHETVWSRIRALLLCVLMILFLCCTSFAVVSVTAIEESDPRAEIKSRLMWKIQYLGWDPYSEDMTLEEFYALMELFDEGKLPLGQKPRRAPALGMGDAGMEDPGIEGSASGRYIPRSQFLFAGLGEYTGDGAPLGYDNVKGAVGDDGEADSEDSEDIQNYPSGLDPYGGGYKRPPKDWEGISVNENLQAVIVKENENDTNPHVSGNVVQDLFKSYDGFYVRRVTVSGVDAAVLGMIKMNDSTDKYVYYYLSSEDQDTKVSTTTLPEGEKFIIQYVPNEHKIDYEVKMATAKEDSSEGEDDLKDVTQNWSDIIFSSHPSRTTDGAYAFDVVVPYGYELTVVIQYKMNVGKLTYKKQNGGEDEVVDVIFEVEEEVVGRKNFKQAIADNIRYDMLKAYAEFCETHDIQFNVEDSRTITNGDGTTTLTYINPSDNVDNGDSHQKVLDRIAERVNAFTNQNGGWPLGREPVYDTNRANKGAFITPDTTKGPETFTVNATFYNNLVREDRTVVAILKKIDTTPRFIAPIIASNTDNITGRGSSAITEYSSDANFYTEKYGKKWYDYEKEFLYYKEQGRDKNDDGNALGNVRTADSWNWSTPNKTGYGNDKTEPNNSSMAEEGEGLGTYYWQWTFQTNSSAGGYTLDTLAINGVSMSIPFYPHYTAKEGNTTAPEEYGIRGYKTELTLSDGTFITLEFVVQFGDAPQQRVYRLTVEHAKSNIAVTGMNLMQGTGAREISTYELTGVYAPDEQNTSQTAAAIQYYGNNGEWSRETVAQVVVDDGGGIKYAGDPEKYSANVRFQAVDGYGSPYFLFEGTTGTRINASIERNEDGTINLSTQKEIKYFSELEEEKIQTRAATSLELDYVYYDDTAENGEGWYYIRLKDQEPDKIGLLTIVARPSRYVVRYMTDGIDESGSSVKGEVQAENMPTFEHGENSHESFRDELGKQYDDNNGFYYDVLSNLMAAIPSDANGIIRPTDKNSTYNFVDWVVVDSDGNPIKINEQEVHYLSQAINISTLADYAIKNDGLGGADLDIYVIRLKPVWKKIENPFNYNVVLKWVDAEGVLHEEGFSGYWDKVVTETPTGGNLYVYLNKLAIPLLNWIAQHPTYNFWDAVNNASGEEAIKKALEAYLKGETLDEEILGVLQNSTTKNNFMRLGSDMFVVTESGGTINIWMYEDKGGLVFHKDVQEEPFIYDDEFYFTVTEAKEKEGKPLDGKFYAYPEPVYTDGEGSYTYDETGKSPTHDTNGNSVRLITYADAWHVTFQDGKIVSIEKDGKKTEYFTLQHGEGIALYVPAGTYTIAELGSKSGGSYKVNVNYSGDKEEKDKNGWVIPDGKEKELWLRGSAKEFYKDETEMRRLTADKQGKVSQVSATVNFEIGAHNVVQTLTFTNITTSLSIEKSLDALEENKKGITDAYKNALFTIKVKLKLPQEFTPLMGTKQSDSTSAEGNGTEYYYFNANRYTVTYSTDKNGKTQETITPTKTEELKFTKEDKSDKNEESDIWTATFTIKAGERVIIVMQVAEGEVNYWVSEEQEVQNYTGSDAEDKKDEKGNVTLKALELTPLISPSSNKAKPGKKAVVKVVNWYGDLPGYGYLKISQTDDSLPDNDTYTYLFRITSARDGTELIVSLKRGETIYVYLPCGSYTIEEITDWAWRFEDGSGKATDLSKETAGDEEADDPSSEPLTVIITTDNDTRKKAMHAEYSHDPNYKGWLGGESSTQDSFKPSANESTDVS